MRNVEATDRDENDQRGPLNIRLRAAGERYGSTPHLISGCPCLVTGFAGRRRYPMISNKTVAAQFSSSRDVGPDGGNQGPMAQQNTHGSGSYELHPQKLVQLVGCRDLNAIALSSERESRLQ